MEQTKIVLAINNSFCLENKEPPKRTSGSFPVCEMKQD